jgi:hypothetical protein
LEKPDSDVDVFDTALDSKTLRGLATPFGRASPLQKQMLESQKMAKIMDMDGNLFEALAQGATFHYILSQMGEMLDDR